MRDILQNFYRLLKQKFWQISIIIVSVVISFSPIFTNEFVWDDEDLIVNWPAIRSWSNVPASFVSPTHPNYLDTYRPIRFVLATATYSLFGDNPAGYHAVTLLIHLSATVLVYFILTLLTKNQPIPFLTALFFGVHPVHTEAITWMSSGLDMIGIVFLLASVYLFLRAHRSNTGFGASICFAMLAYFSLELTVILPFLLVLMVWSGTINATAQTYRSILPYGLGTAAFLTLRWMFVPVHGEFIYIDEKFYLTMLTMCHSFLAYLSTLVWPMNLTVNHALGSGISSFMVEITNDFPQALAAIRSQRFTDPHVISTVAIIAIALYLCVRLRKTVPLASLGIGWLFLSLLPVSNIIPIHTLMAERYLYLPSVGFCILLSICIAPLFHWQKTRIAGVIMMTIVTLFSMSLTIARNTEWKNGLTLWTTALERNPNSYIAAVALGKQYLLRQDVDRAIATYERILTVYPEQKNIIDFLTNLYLHQKNYEKALHHARVATTLQPDASEPWIKLGDVYRARNEHEEARGAYEKALVLDPKSKTAASRLAQ